MKKYSDFKAEINEETRHIIGDLSISHKKHARAILNVEPGPKNALKFKDTRGNHVHVSRTGGMNGDLVTIRDVKGKRNHVVSRERFIGNR